MANQQDTMTVTSESQQSLTPTNYTMIVNDIKQKIHEVNTPFSVQPTQQIPTSTLQQTIQPFQDQENNNQQIQANTINTARVSSTPTHKIQNGTQTSAPTIDISNDLINTSIHIPSPPESTQINMITTSLDDLAICVLTQDKQHHTNQAFQIKSDKHFSHIELLLEQVLNIVKQKKQQS